MKVCEIRDLDGPNIFLRMPAIKLEVASDDGAFQVSTAATAFSIGESDDDGGLETVGPDRLTTLIVEVVNVLHDQSGQERPLSMSRAMEEPHHYAVAFTWAHRRFALALGEIALGIVMGEYADPGEAVGKLKAILASPAEDDDVPEMVSNADSSIPIIAVTGTNGKTTTSRLISSILRNSGKTVGLTSSAGVYIDKEQIIAGDYSGPSGAHRVLVDDRVEVAVLETARGGMLLRGLGYEESDVSVVTNVSADHLGMHGVLTLEGLAEVKSLVPRMTREGGFAVLNADDPLVLAMRHDVRARPFLVSRLDISLEIQAHIDDRGWALTMQDGQMIWWHDGLTDAVTSISDVPMTFGGRAPHMVENALCAAAASLAYGLPIDQVRGGLAAFKSSATDNHGRLNVYEKNGATLVIDFAHNEAGLRKLLEFGRQFREGEGTVTAVVGTAGDRDDDAFRSLGQVAAEHADIVIKKDTTKYLRGRNAGDMLRLMQEGVERAGTSVLTEEAASEREACLRAFARAGHGDVVAVMCIEDYDFLLQHLDDVATPVS